MCSRNCLTLLLAAAAAASSVALGADPVSYTDPVGFVKLGNTTGGATPAVAANTDVRLSIPLESELMFSGTFDSATGGVVTVTGSPGWTIDVWAPSPGSIYSFVVTSGPEDGLRGMITDNSANTLTVTQTTLGNLGSIGATNTIEIRKAWTLKSLLSNDTTDLYPGVQALFFSGIEVGSNLASSSSAVWSGTTWIYLSGAPNPAPDNANDLILHPGESFILRTAASAITSMTIFGDVPLANHRSTIEKFADNVTQDTTIGFFGPTPELLSESGLGFAPGDQLLVFDPTESGKNKASAQSLVYSGTAWIGLSGIDPADVPSFALQPGVGYVYRQASPTDPAVYDWSNTPGPTPAP